LIYQVPVAPAEGGTRDVVSQVRTITRSLRRWYSDESAQDLVEYAYLSAFVGLAGLAVWTAIVQLLGARYADYNSGVQSLWCTPGTSTINCP
jgi:Flp pilus assembly pilin Flp